MKRDHRFLNIATFVFIVCTEITYKCQVENMTDLEDNYKYMKQGAEGKIFYGEYLGKPAIVKERFVKSYRHPDLDISITKERIKAEARSILRCKSIGVNVPTVYLVDFERRRIYMEHIENTTTVKDFIVNVVETAKEEERMRLLNILAEKIGETIGKIHEHNIIHGDLTTSNMLLKTEGSNISEETDIYLIDFGLSHVESSSEDKGVDLYVLERAIISTHSDSSHLFTLILNFYKKSNSSREILEKFEEIRARGRKRTMVG